MTAAPGGKDAPPIGDRRELVEWFEQGCKPPSAWRCGTEHEKFVFRRSDLSRPAHDAPDGIGELLRRLERFGWRPVREAGNTIALAMGEASITLEPGGQFELSGAPLETVHDTCDEVRAHLDQCREVGDELGLGFLGVGFDPKWRRADIPWMPKGRYAVMRRYMPKVGSLGLDMMLRTCTVQVNLDYSDETDMVEKFRLSLALQPLATVLFADSPFREGAPSGWLSLRSHVWTDTDPDRCGMLGFVFEDGFGFERYVDYCLDVPMYFVYRDGRYIDVAGRSFRDFLAGRLPELPGERPHIGDWSDHVTTAFPEVRMKRYLELRGADGGPWGRLCGLPALWMGLLYDGAARAAAWDLCKHWTDEERERLRVEAPERGFATRIGGRALDEVARDMVAIARQGLKARNRLDGAGSDETGFLGDLEAIAASGVTPAEEKQALFRGRWRGSVDPLFEEFAY